MADVKGNSTSSAPEILRRRYAKGWSRRMAIWFERIKLRFGL